MRKRLVAGFVGGLIALLTPGVVPAQTAAASTPVTIRGVINHSCGPNQDPNRLAHKTSDDIAHVTIGHARIALRGGATAGYRTFYYWARITGGKVGNTAWLDWGDSPSAPPRSWHECGPYRIRSGHDTHTRAVNYVRDNRNARHFRACGHHAGETKCTKWVF
ncbi:hypothetical protein [Streptomyces sp. NPDC001811]